MDLCRQITEIELKIGNNVIPQCNRIVYLRIDFKLASSLSVDCVERTQKSLGAVFCT